MFVVSKIFWYLATPGNLLLVVLTAGALLLWTRRWRTGRVLVAGMVAAGVLVALLPVGSWLIGPLEDRFQRPVALPDRVDGIIVLGGSVNPRVAHWRDEPALNEHAERLTTFIALARRYPEAQLIFTGGSGSLVEPEMKEAPVTRAVLEQTGFDISRVRFEDDSRNTYENALLSAGIARPKAGERWILVTSAFHMPRAIGCFRRIGWPVIAYPVDYTTTGKAFASPGWNFIGGMSTVEKAVHEWVGLLAYRLLGRTEALFPAP